MATSSSGDPRVTRLTKYFNDVLYDRRTLTTSRDGKLFLESLCAQPDPATCVHKLISSTSGLAALQASMRFDTSPSFLNDHGVNVITYLQSPGLRTIDSGAVLAKVLLSIVEPPFFWEAYSKAFSGSLLNTGATSTYAWLLLQLVSLPGKDSSPYVRLASSSVLDALLASSDRETRIIGQKIKHVLSLSVVDLHIDAEAKPGGRHDNDHEDYRQITIMPTADELLSKDQAFLRPANFIDDPELAKYRRNLYVDNQFRLLRHDMLGEIKEEIKALMGVKQGRHKGLAIDNLQLHGVEMGTERKRQAWGVKLQCRDALPQLNKIALDRRKAFLSDNRHFLRQGNMACLFIDKEPAAFPTILRLEDELILTPAIITVQFQDDDTLSYVLMKLKSAISIKLVQLDTAVFAYEPFLRRLQHLKDLPLAAELLFWEEGKDISEP